MRPWVDSKLLCWFVFHGRPFEYRGREVKRRPWGLFLCSLELHRAPRVCSYCRLRMCRPCAHASVHFMRPRCAHASHAVTDMEGFNSHLNMEQMNKVSSCAHAVLNGTSVSSCAHAVLNGTSHPKHVLCSPSHCENQPSNRISLSSDDAH